MNCNEKEEYTLEVSTYQQPIISLYKRVLSTATDLAAFMALALQ